VAAGAVCLFLKIVIPEGERKWWSSAMHKARSSREIVSRIVFLIMWKFGPTPFYAGHAGSG
jgi:hypothetical protein